jgi:UrcA family protein
MQRSHRKLSIFMGAAAALLVSPAFAAAQSDAPDYQRVEVRYSGIDLDQVAGAQKLYTRISSAAREACRQPGILFRTSVFNECVDKAVEGAVNSVSNENLTAVHLSKSGNRSVAALSR